jgi:FAD/FMN-containing dehydrogenase
VETASEDENDDLLWALRGGGGNFGIVTELRFRLHAIGPILLSGFLAYRRERAAEVLRFYRGYMEEAPEQVGGGLALFAGRGGNCHVAFCYAGPIEDGERAVAPFRELRPSLDAVRPNEYRAFQAMTDLQNPFGMRCRLRGAFLRELTDEALEVAIAQANRVAPALSHVLLQPVGGAMRRLDPNAMALSVPDARWGYECIGLWPPISSLDRACVDWVDGFAAAMRPFSVGVRYPALVAPDEGEREKLIASYAPAHATLQRLKARYDPANVFRPNPNIEPAGDRSRPQGGEQEARG